MKITPVKGKKYLHLSINMIIFLITKLFVMKKIIIGSLIGSILLFGWQSLSWTTLHVHDDAYQYTSSQETLLTTIKNNLPNEGQYILPSIPPNSSSDAMDSLGRKMNGNPWAIISYHKSYEYDMVMPIIRGF